MYKKSFRNDEFWQNTILPEAVHFWERALMVRETKSTIRLNSNMSASAMLLDTSERDKCLPFVLDPFPDAVAGVPEISAGIDNTLDNGAIIPPSKPTDIPLKKSFTLPVFTAAASKGC
ncbi:Leishmanolysin-like peptidase [Temnothorax longispinosus]|uniref:Leishmanolysin-like peptidase n=1 Tax=Temnothorax longispinosus TaxID=300112 RepID=A0A4S2KU16_9HYME|nr:Leishmanolysin-like peptidase [Temnothorax longispinosus]